MKKISTLVAVLLLTLAGTPLSRQAASLTWQAKVDDWVLQTAQQGPTEFMLFLKDQADLSRAQSLPTKAEKGAYVVQQLVQTAQRTQGPILAALQDMASTSKVEYRPYWIVNAIWVRGDAEVVQALARRSDVAHVYANPRVKLALPEQPEQPAQLLAPEFVHEIEWNIQRVNAPLAWAAGFTGQGVVIGGQDTGYAWDHPALKSAYRGWNGVTADHNYNWHDAIHANGGICGNDSPVPCDGFNLGHGTHTMGIMVGDAPDDGFGNTYQIGVAPGARWIGCRNMDSGGFGSPASYMECYQWFVAPTDLNGQNQRADLAPDAINNSWSCPTYEGCPIDNPDILKKAVENVTAAGILTVQSAGNEGNGCYTVNAPAGIYAASFTVGMTDFNDIIASRSSRGSVTIDGSNRLKPDVSAPGISIYSSVPPSGYSYMDGTSMAAPHVAGLAALLLSAQPQLKGQVDRIRTLIEQSAVPRTTSQTCGGVPGSHVPNNTYGWGRVDAWQTIQNLPRQLDLYNTPSSFLYNLGQTITYTLKVDYTYPLTPTHHLVITDVIPTDTTFVAATSPYTKTGDTITWGLPSLGPNQSTTRNLVVRVSLDAGEQITNQSFSASSDELGPEFGDPVTIYLGKFTFLPFIGK